MCHLRPKKGDEASLFATNIQQPKDTACHQTPASPPTASVTKIWDVVIGVTPVTLGGVVGDSQVVESGQEHQQPYYDDGNGTVRVLCGYKKKKSL